MTDELDCEGHDAKADADARKAYRASLIVGIAFLVWAIIDAIID